MRNMLIYRLCSRLPDQQIREAVLKSLPQKKSGRVRCLRRLSRHLKRLDPKSTPLDYRHVIEEWRKLADPKSDADETWQNFIKEWSAVDLTVKPFTETIRCQIDSEGGDSEYRVCRAVVLTARYFWRNIFFVSTRQIESMTGVSHTRAAIILRRLVSRGCLRVVQPGRANPFDRVATTFDISPLVSLSGADVIAPSPDTYSGLPTIGCPPRQKLRKSGVDDVMVNPVYLPSDSQEFGSTPGQREALRLRQERVRLAAETPVPW